MKKFVGENAMLEMAQDTINWFYGRFDRTNANAESGNCRYSPLGGEKQGCAIGRYLEKKIAKRCDSFENSWVRSRYVQDVLPYWMREMSIDFLRELQRLHDGNHFANKNNHHIEERLKPYIDVTKLTFPKV